MRRDYHFQQTCKFCNQPDKFDFTLPNDVWQKALPKELHNRVVCLYCFDDFAKDANVFYGSKIQNLYFAGKQASLCFTRKATN